MPVAPCSSEKTKSHSEPWRVCVCCGSTSQLAQYHSSLLALPRWDGCENWEGKIVSTSGLTQRLGKAKASCPSKTKIYFFPLTDRCSVTSRKQGLLCVMITLDDKCHHFKHSPLSFFTPLLLLSMMLYGMAYSFGQARSAILAVIFPSFFFTLDPLNARGA